MQTVAAGGDLGPNYGACKPQGGGERKAKVELRLQKNRFDDRRLLLTGLDNRRRSLDDESLVDQTDRYQQQAFEVITRGVAEAFDLSRERSETVASYDTPHLFKNSDVHRWYDMSRASNLLGKQRSEEHTSELQSRTTPLLRLLLHTKKTTTPTS